MILSIESSCDESALALWDVNSGCVGHWIMSQLIHSEYGGVVPGIAIREHFRNFPILFDCLLKKLQTFGISNDSRKFSRNKGVSDFQIDSISVTYGPGLAGSLAMGVSLAKALKLAWNLPLFGINHLRGHAFSPFIDIFEKDPKNFETKLSSLLPHLGLLVSGGNTLLFSIENELEIEILAETQDDAAGEVLDKGAKLLGLEYPGGQKIENLALQGDPNAFNFPRAFAHSKEMKFSFSGLKTSLYYFLQKRTKSETDLQLADICASYQEAVCDQLINKMSSAMLLRKYSSIGLSGGVSRNSRLRSKLLSLGTKFKTKTLLTNPDFTGDNAVMIAFASFIDKNHSINDVDFNLSINPSLSLLS